MDALGYSAAKVREDLVDISYDGKAAAVGGVGADTPVAELQEVLGRPAFTLAIDLHLGPGRATVYSCNCTEEYVRINV
jgi:glutamate N-acetyltransferase/amino-acid N-acetyltransferase